MVRIFPNWKLEIRLFEALVLLILVDLQGLGMVLTITCIYILGPALWQYPINDKRSIS